MSKTDDLADEVIDRFKELPTRVDLDKVKAYARAFAEYALSRVADDLLRNGHAGASYAVRDKVDEIIAEDA